jgi:hypothetical protein
MSDNSHTSVWLLKLKKHSKHTPNSKNLIQCSDFILKTTKKYIESLLADMRHIFFYNKFALIEAQIKIKIFHSRSCSNGTKIIKPLLY